MPRASDNFHRSCVGIDIDAVRSGIHSHDAVMFDIKPDDLARFNACVAVVAPGTPPLAAEQIVGAARRLTRAVGAGNQSRFIRARMRRAGEIRALLNDPNWRSRPALLARMRSLVDYLDGPLTLVPAGVPAVADLDGALLVDLAMNALRGELDEYADFRRYRAAEAARLGVALELIDIDRDRWTAERSLEVQLERRVRHARDVGYVDGGGIADLFRVS